MKDKIQNLIKNVIEENAIKVKEATNQALYGKVGNRLKQEYINVSKNVFKSFNESVDPTVINNISTDDVASAVSAVPPNPGRPPRNSPKDDPEPPYAEDPGPWTGGPMPSRENYPKGKDGTNQYLRDMQRWRQYFEIWKQEQEAFKRYVAWLARNRHRFPQRS